ncbi:MAG: glutamate racemase [Bdellovibrionales bacterium RIFOXYB1_FULL_37_110]|nr:MAG: glutamate racemase [Bdellovibrionales bacterium RIFOXYA1_FULL_38_20]OFZ50192.1 MAG: glutamate racemase [Bdellovibrionales bacterium RIFOXYC1_FULL_37_79]OFZ53235.1 MAG: glutamate racemase [Bdellovibrionales bacterium RIFOXYB2_FULL_36_6]OFZ57629.1 MAG: glutamate racemase [Bdellovibrionales bacterium RIFOXYB1_FULL_37_110]OFZ61396.1 MAG: glutamate racemase [Bdellovibrionales bacterium RIFOXYD1_FULL_36_51]
MIRSACLFFMENKKIKIGMFDSGVGGLSILSDVHELMTDLEVYYIADNAFCPYGEKSEIQLVERATEITHLLLQKDVQLITLACNTITAAAIKKLREKFSIPFVGVEPYLNAYNKEEEIKELSKLAVLTTKYTASSEKFWSLKNRLDPQNRIVHATSDKLAMLIEDIFNTGFDHDKKKLVEQELAPLKDQGFTHVILGCTHYPLISSFIENYLSVKCIAPGRHVALRIQDLLIHQLHYQPTDTCLPDFWYFNTLFGTWGKKKHQKIELM